MAKKSRKIKVEHSKSSRNVLFISYFFPPTAGGGVFRPLAMTRYLAKMGWNITVLTATTPKHYPVDNELEKQIPGNVRVIQRKVVWEGKLVRRSLGKAGLDWIPKHLITPDERVFWADKAEKKASKLLKTEKFDLLYTTGPPFSINLCGVWLKRRFDIPWVVEFRDPWTLAPYLTIPNAHQRRFAEDTESDFMEMADRVVMVTPTFTELMKEKYPEHAEKLVCITNGFDYEDFRGLGSRANPGNSEFTIVASGTVFGRNNMNDFLKALGIIRKDHPDLFARIRVFFQGLPDQRLNRKLLESGLNERCDSRGFRSHSDNINDLRNADLLLLPLAKVPNAHGHIPSRTYEYLASGTPILAAAPDGDLKKLISNFPQVTCIDIKKPDEAVNAIIQAFNNWKNGDDPPAVGAKLLHPLTRKAAANEMSKLFAELTGAV